MKFDAIILDFDNVLVESAKGKSEAWRRLYEPHIGDTAKQLVEYAIDHEEMPLNEKIKYFHKTFLKEDLAGDDMEEWLQDYIRLAEEEVVKAPVVAGAKEFLNSYYRQIQILLVSETPAQELKRIARKRDMAHFFKRFQGGSKKAENIEQLLKEQNLSRDRVLMIGSSLSDLEAAKKAGIKFLGRVPDTRKSSFSKDVDLIVDFVGLEKFFQ